MSKRGITKDQYLLRNFSKITHKKWELYVITRVLHLLNDKNIEYVCQQYINPTNSSKYYLADLCFPTLKLYLEINEGQHATEEHTINDKIRQREILDATDWEQKSIRVYKVDKFGNLTDRSLDDVDKDIDNFLKYLKCKKTKIEEENGEALHWNYEKKYLPDQYIEKGFIDVSDNAVFLYHRDALRLFGYSGSHYQRAYWMIKGHKQAVWFPKLYDNNPWKNSLSKDNEEIVQQKFVNGLLEDVILPGDENRIIFAHYKNILGQTVYKFYGEYQVDWDKTVPNKHVFKRVTSRLDLLKYQK